MTFITLNNSARVKIKNIINYVATTQPEGVATLYVINIWQATQFATAFVSVQYANQVQRDADLLRLDAAVNGFVEPTPALSLSGQLLLHYAVTAFPQLLQQQQPIQPIQPVTISHGNVTSAPPATS